MNVVQSLNQEREKQKNMYLIHKSSISNVALVFLLVYATSITFNKAGNIVPPQYSRGQGDASRGFTTTRLVIGEAGTRRMLVS